MEILTVKNNKMDYSTFKKIIILFFPTKYKIIFITVFSLDFIGLLLGLFIRDFSFFVIVSVILLLEVKIHLTVSIKNWIKTINEPANRTIQQRCNIF